MSNAVGKKFNEFLYFHEQTVGKSGRPVFIDPNLLLPFIDLIDTRLEAGRDLAAMIIELRNQAGNILSETNLNTPSEHRSNLGHIQVTYSVVQDKAENNRGPGVYITGISILDMAENGEPYSYKPGFYLVEKGDGGVWRAHEDVRLSKMETVIGAIGAKTDGVYYDAKASARDYATQIQAINNDGFVEPFISFLYAPGYIIDSLGTWKTSEQKKLGSESLQSFFAKILRDTVPGNIWGKVENLRENHKWYVFDDGVKFLQESLDKFKIIAEGRTLSKHSFYFVNPRSNLGPLLLTLNSLDAKVDKKRIYDLTDITSKIHQSLNIESLNRGLMKYQGEETNVSGKVLSVKKHVNQKYLSYGENKTFASMIKDILKDNVINGGWS